MKKQDLQVWKLATDSNRDLNLRTEIDYFQTHFVGKRMQDDWQPPLPFAAIMQGKSQNIVPGVTE